MLLVFPRNPLQNWLGCVQVGRSVLHCENVGGEIEFGLFLYSYTLQLLSWEEKKNLTLCEAENCLIEEYYLHFTQSPLHFWRYCLPWDGSRLSGHFLILILSFLLKHSF